MLQYILITAFVFQALVLAAIIGTSIRDARQYKVPFGRLFISEKMQVVVLFWLMASIFVNITFICLM